MKARSLSPFLRIANAGGYATSTGIIKETCTLLLLASSFATCPLGRIPGPALMKASPFWFSLLLGIVASGTMFVVGVTLARKPSDSLALSLCISLRGCLCVGAPFGSIACWRQRAASSSLS